MTMTAAVDTRELVRLQRQYPKRNEAAMSQAVAAEARRLNLVVKKYAASEGEGEFLPYAPYTKIWHRSKRGGYGPWFAKLTRYWISDESAIVGIIDRETTGMSYSKNENFRDIIQIPFKFHAPKYGVIAAKRQARGYSFNMTRARQRAIAVHISRKYERFESVFGGKWHEYVPKLGVHRVKARPVVEPVFARERHRSIRNMKKIFITKIQGGRYSRDWITEWGSA